VLNTITEENMFRTEENTEISAQTTIVAVVLYGRGT
jgi:hypothetical protein